MKKIFSITFILFLSLQICAEKLVLEWAVPLKDNILTQLNRREQGGVTAFGKDLLVTTSKGEMHLFSTKGTIKKTVKFDGVFVHEPQVLNDGNLLVTVSNAVFLLKPDLTKVWATSGKAPVASKPLVKDQNIYVQFMDNSVYLLDRKNGEIKTAYTYYTDEDISLLRLS
jgi:outer membrane protein assembly factor BamB